MKGLENKSVAVTGCCGTVGGELVRQLLEDYKVGELVGLDNNETEMFFLQQGHKDHDNAKFFLSSIRDRERLIELFKGVDTVFHAAAYKHVSLCEHSPFDAVQTNIIGVKNVIEAAKECGVERVIFTSSDKAVNPTNVMGTTKLMGERLMTAANCARKGEGPIYTSTRFGNVLGSRGSVIPIFLEQIRKGGPVTLTDRKMTRFIMSIKEATNLVIDSSAYAKGGEIFVTKMPVIRIVDLAQVMIDQMASHYGHKPENIEIITIGTKPGEKLYEELMSDEETGRTYELENYFAVLPSYRSLYREINYEYTGVVSTKVDNPYHSANEPALSQAELSDFLQRNNLLEESLPARHPAERFWEA
ncbi:polysaccharide biosynthesis protein [uncultured Thiodictyon sp.]|uniref:polysaccharide biosynthesis protein n=1 Tax=uncultured Thiodictyon sp. TaxID=1846217 RepID=UPI0025FE9E52|nr:polysaccharide biosynthesis protein [uncultured Thiodictyon sp.]